VSPPCHPLPPSLSPLQSRLSLSLPSLPLRFRCIVDCCHHPIAVAPLITIAIVLSIETGGILSSHASCLLLSSSMLPPPPLSCLLAGCCVDASASCPLPSLVRCQPSCSSSFLAAVAAAGSHSCRCSIHSNKRDNDGAPPPPPPSSPRPDGGTPWKIPSNGSGGNISCIVGEFGFGEIHVSATIVDNPLTLPLLLPPSNARCTLLAVAAPAATALIATTALANFTHMDSALPRVEVGHATIN
jgi:hypothetical protein